MQTEQGHQFTVREVKSAKERIRKGVTRQCNHDNSVANKNTYINTYAEHPLKSKNLTVVNEDIGLLAFLPNDLLLPKHQTAEEKAKRANQKRDNAEEVHRAKFAKQAVAQAKRKKRYKHNQR